MSRPRLSSRIQRTGDRGFTLVELMVALSAGIAVSGAAYILSKNSMEVFTQESRIAQAQFSALLGLNRMASDIQRAGFMASPDFVKPESGACGPSADLKLIKAIQVNSASTDGSPSWQGTTALIKKNFGKDPDHVRLVGNFSSVELFRFRAIEEKKVFLTINEGAMQRTLLGAAKGGPSILEIFRPGRYVRLVDAMGKQTYSKISLTKCTGDTLCASTAVDGVEIDLDTAPPANGAVCGNWTNPGFINPVSIVDYWIGTPNLTDDGIYQTADKMMTAQNTAQNQLTGPGIDVTGESTRTELVRQERESKDGTATKLLTTSAGLAAPSEIVAEYAVDLRLSVTARTAETDTTTSYHDREIATDIPTIPPSTYVGVTASVSTRTRAPERAVGITDVNHTRARFDVFALDASMANVTNRWARVRTEIQEVNLPNLAGIKW